MSHDPYTLPRDLPVPEDDGAADHLEGMRIPRLELPFEVDGMTPYRRLTLIAEAGEILKVLYPVFPPDRNASEVLAWLQANR